MSEIIKNSSHAEDKSKFLNISTQNKLIILGSLLSSILIVITAWIVIDNTQKTMIKSYHNFGLMLAKTLAVENIDTLSAKIDDQTKQKLELGIKSIIRNNKDISYVIFRDPQGKVLFSNKQPNLTRDELQKIIDLNTPVVVERNGQEEVIGSVQLGLTGNTMNMVGKATRNLMIIVFTVAWILSIAAILINTLLITRQITLLVDGVKKISTGEFGYKLASRDLWGEIKQLFEAFNDMSMRLRQYEEKNIDQLTYERNKLEAVLMSIANGVVVCDNYDQIVLINNAAIKMLGASAKEIINTRILEYCDINGSICFKKDIMRFKETPLEEMEMKPLDCQIDINNKIIKTIMSPMFSIHQEYLGYIVVMHDVTKEAEIDKLKNTFISNVSHELRTPVTVLRSYIDTLHNFGKDFDEETKYEFLSIMNQEADRLNKLVNDILDFSRLESPNVEIEKTPSDIGPIIELTARSMKVLAEERHLSFSIIIEPDLPKVMINPESIERVLKNLISNAIKYSNEGGKIKIRAEVNRVGTHLQVSIEDNGIGIPGKHMEKIFDRFYRVENKTHAIKGTGLGLHLVKITIEKHHNGEVFVESKEDEGSTFGFKIPLDQVEQEIL